MNLSAHYSFESYHKDNKFIIHYLAKTARMTSETAHLSATYSFDTDGKKMIQGKCKTKLYEFSINDWRTLAIAIKDSGCVVSKDFMVLLQNIICKRKEYAQWCLAIGRGNSEEHASHQHVVEVLQNIFEMLKIKCPD